MTLFWHGLVLYAKNKGLFMWGFTYVTEASQIFRLLQQRVLKGKYWFCRFFKQFVQSGLTPPKSIMNSNESIFDTGISDTTSMPYGRSGSRSSKSSESFAGFRYSQLPLVTWRWTSHKPKNIGMPQSQKIYKLKLLFHAWTYRIVLSC